MQSYPTNDILTDESLYIRELQNYIRTIQQAEHGTATLGIDGIYGNDTYNAVCEFQQKSSMEITGTVDEMTWNAIVEEAAAIHESGLSAISVKAFTVTLKEGDNGDGVICLEMMLEALHRIYANIPKPDAIPSPYGKQTAIAVKAFQRLVFLPETGVCDRQTWNKIANLYNVR